MKNIKCYLSAYLFIEVSIAKVWASHGKWDVLKIDELVVLIKDPRSRADRVYQKTDLTPDYFNSHIFQNTIAFLIV